MVERFLLYYFAVSSHGYTRGTFTTPESSNVADRDEAPVAYASPGVVTAPVYLKWMLAFEEPETRTVWLGKAVPTEFLQQAFGWPSLEGVDASALRLLPADSSPLAGYLNGVCELLRANRAGWLAVRVMKQGEGDAWLQRALVEDQTRQMMAYSEFLNHCHRFVTSRVS